jgi:hypothetical protein
MMTNGVSTMMPQLRPSRTSPTSKSFKSKFTLSLTSRKFVNDTPYMVIYKRRSEDSEMKEEENKIKDEFHVSESLKKFID